MFHGMNYVMEVYKEQSFSKAAQNLYISQPALSAAIKKIEKKIGQPDPVDGVRERIYTDYGEDTGSGG